MLKPEQVARLMEIEPAEARDALLSDRAEIRQELERILETAKRGELTTITALTALIERLMIERLK